MRSIAPLVLILLIVLTGGAIAHAEVGSNGVLVIPITGTITSITYEFMREAYEYAESNSLPIVLLIDTPGGSLDATFKIIDTIERSKIPTIGYVTPAGARAWSAGTVILMSTQVAAMSPNTIIGSAQPVSYDPLGGGSTPVDDPKVINALTKYIEERARRNKRDPVTAAKFVSENLNLNDEEALSLGMIEYKAENLDALLKTIDGKVIEFNSVELTFRTKGVIIEDWNPSPRISLLNIISEPLVSYLFFILGFYALYFGLQSPGLGSEVFGVISLILGLIGLGVIGINVGALVILAIGFGLLIAEIINPGFGVLGVGGVLMASLGSLLLFPREWAVQTDWLNTFYTTLMVVPLLTGIFVLIVAYKVVEAKRRRPFQSTIVGRIGVVQSEISPAGGYVTVEGELWGARSIELIGSGTRVKVISKEGSILNVEVDK